MSNNLMSTRIKGKYCVSTIYRQCSAVGAYGSWYYETMVFNLKDDGSLGAIADQAEDSTEGMAVRTHNNFVSEYCAELPEIEERVKREHYETEQRIAKLMESQP